MIRRTAILFCLFTFFSLFPGNISARKTADNFSIMDSLFQQGSSEILKFVSEQNAGKVAVNSNGHSASRLLLSKLEQDFSSGGIQLFDKAGNDIFQLEIRIIKTSVAFDNIETSGDSLQRSIYFTFSGKISNPDGRIKILPEKSYTYTDTTSRDETEFLNSAEHEFAKAPLPPEKRTFWEEALEPVIFVSTAAVTVLLLFSVRSD